MTRVETASVAGPGQTPAATVGSFDLSIIIPTFNEAENVPVLLRRLAKVLTGTQIPAEVWIVDDASPDGTAEVARQVDVPLVVRVIERSGPRGLSPAVVDGLRVARGTHVLVMDADLQHPPEAIPKLLGALRAGADFAIGSRYVAGGAANEFGLLRVLNSKIATWMAVPLVGSGVRDPMAGFFCFRRADVDAETLNPVGYKIGLELLVKSSPGRVVEVPIDFGSRHAGQSKLSFAEQLSYLQHLRKLYAHRWPTASQAALYCAVGACGMVVDLACMTVLMTLGVVFSAARVASILVALVGNFVLNRAITFPEANRRAWRSQFVKYALVCMIGLVLNWGVSTGLYHALPAWHGAYLLFCLVGIVAGTASNFLLSKHIVFRAGR